MAVARSGVGRLMRNRTLHVWVWDFVDTIPTIQTRLMAVRRIHYGGSSSMVRCRQWEYWVQLSGRILGCCCRVKDPGMDELLLTSEPHRFDLTNPYVYCCFIYSD